MKQTYMSLKLNLSERRRLPEIMDQPDLDPLEHKRALAGLSRLNRVSGGSAIYWPELAGLIGEAGPRPVRVLDLACGGGDVALDLARRGGDRLVADGCDFSPTAVRLAAERAQARKLGSRFFQLDVLQDAIPTDYDVLICSLFFHHLAEEDAVATLSKMAGACRILLVQDLIRCRAGYLLAKLACNILSRSPVVRHDGPASVLSAFTMPEMLALAERAGLAGAAVVKRWPERFLLKWSSP